GPRAASRRAPRAVGRDPVRVGPALPAEDLSGARVGSRRSGGGRERVGASRAEDRVRAGGLLTRPKPLLQYPNDSRNLRLGTLGPSRPHSGIDASRAVEAARREAMPGGSRPFPRERGLVP